MTRLVEIRKAKEIGRLVRASRESQHLSVQALAGLSGYSVNQMVNLENGNIYAFHENLDHFIELAVHSAEKMNVDPSVFSIKSKPSSNEPFSIEDSIPVFLQKMA